MKSVRTGTYNFAGTEKAEMMKKVEIVNLAIPVQQNSLSSEPILTF